jgi:hypothetical protein
MTNMGQILQEIEARQEPKQKNIADHSSTVEIHSTERWHAKHRTEGPRQYKQSFPAAR